MSRIQNILEKAERDGAVRRMRPVTEPAGATLAVDTPVPMASVSAMPPAEVPPVFVVDEAPSAAAITAASSIRTMRSHLDRVLVAALAPGAFAAEQYRGLRTRLAHGDHRSPVDVILITSPGRREGKSLTAANLALTMGQDFQSRICLVDADLRHSSQHGLFGVPRTPGLADVLSGAATPRDFRKTNVPGLWLMTAGRTSRNPADLLGSQRFVQLIEYLGKHFDWIVLDTEHAPNEVPGLLSQLQAMVNGTAEPVVRCAWNDAVLLKRILDIDTAPQEVTASDQKRIVVDTFARYRITDPLLFYQTIRD